MTLARREARPRGMLNTGVARLLITLAGGAGVALDVAQPLRHSALRHMASLRTAGIESPHLHAKEAE